MKRKIIPVLIGCTLSFSALAAQPTAERYVVSFPEGTHVNYAGAFASAFPNGLPVGIGSGLLFTGKQGDALTFATITDRGPNADSPKEGKNETKIFVTPDFAPLLMTIRVQNGKAEAIDPRPLHDDKGAINGLPLASDVIGSTNEVAFSDTLHRLKGDNRAEMSPEAAGIAACLMTYSHHACRTECYAMTVHYYRLRDYALQHPECSAIMRIID
ncbi:TPA: antirestriction protein [Escherichia coli]|nr:antirestriction protein [Escherichia coli]